jgi:hypothetical protein
MKIQQVEFHRNGISGAPFHVVLFSDDGKDFIGVVFDEPCHVAVLARDDVATGNVGFGGKWRGDHFEGDLRFACYSEWIQAALDAGNKTPRSIAAYTGYKTVAIKPILDRLQGGEKPRINPL